MPNGLRSKPEEHISRYGDPLFFPKCVISDFGADIEDILINFVNDLKLHTRGNKYQYSSNNFKKNKTANS